MAYTPNYLSQRDPRWSAEKLGFDNTITIGTDGCALTCLATLVNGYGFNETPSSLNEKLKAIGEGNGYIGGLIVWPGLSRAFPDIAFQRIVICRDQPAPLDAIHLSLESGQPVVVEVDRSPSAGLQNHWVVLHKETGNDYLMLDPFPQPPDNQETSLLARFGAGRPAEEVITAVVWYQSTAATPQPLPLPPGNGLIVRVQAAASAGLRLRTAPNTAASIVATEPPGTLLRSLESQTNTLAKLGVLNQWLQVTDAQAHQGFVAAWYLEATSPPPPEDGLQVYVSQSAADTGLRLRAAPNTSTAILATLAPATQLVALEPTAQATAKIGQEGQWLNVRAPGGISGYVAAWYLELTPTPTPNPIPAPGALSVAVSTQAVGGLNLRTSPGSSAPVVKVLAIGTPLQVLEPANTAESKIGITEQWLNVKEPGGQTGYVAAWYVTIQV